MGDSPNPFALTSPSVLSSFNLSIWLWAGSVAAIPPGYVLCDGTLGTPDLRDKFVLGAGDSFAVNEVGGVTVHNHPFTGDGHLHSLKAGSDIDAGSNKDTTTQDSPTTGTTDNRNQRPPFYALCYIMKID